MRAATETWDSGGADDNWNTANNWADDSAPASGDSIVFDSGSNGGDADLNVFINAEYTVNSLTFNSDSPAMDFDSSDWTDWLNIGSGGITNNSTGTILFDITDANAGILHQSADTSINLTSGDITIGSGYWYMETYDLTINGDNDITFTKFSSEDTGTATVTKNGDGKTTITGLVVDTSGTLNFDITNGIVEFQHWDGPDNITVSSGASLYVNGDTLNGDVTIAGTGHNDTGAILLRTSGDRINNNITLSADATIKADADGWFIGGAGSTLDVSTHTLTIDSNSNIVTNGPLAGSGAFIKKGTGDWNPRTGGTFSGDVTVEAGSITLWNTLFNSGTNTLTIKDGAMIDYNFQTDAVENIVLEGDAEITKMRNATAGATTTWTFNATATGKTTSATIDANNPWESILNLNGNALNIVVADNQNTSTATNKDLIIESNITAGSASTISKTGAGTVVYDGNDWDTDIALTVSDGTWAFNDSNSINNSNPDVTAASGGTVAGLYAFTDANFVDKIVTTSAGVIALGADNSNSLDFSSHSSASLGAITVGTDSTHAYSGTLTGASNVIRLGGGGATLDMTGDFSSSTSDQVIIDVNGTESTSVVKYTAAQDYQGDTTVSGGTLLLGASNRISDTSDLVLSGGTFNTGGFNETMATLTLSANSVLDFGSGTSQLIFGVQALDTDLGSSTLSIYNWSGTPGVDGGTDQLDFGAGTTLTKNTQVLFYSDSGSTFLGYGELVNNELVADGSGVVPEPSTWLGITGLLGLCGWHARRRLLLCVKTLCRK